MRFMLFIYPNIPAGGDWTPSVEAVEGMMAYNRKLVEAGVLLSGEGLHPLERGARITYDGTTPIVTDGPYTEAKEVVGGFWILEVASKEEAVEWASRVPAGGDVVIEVRQIAEMSEFPEDLQAAASLD